jgi:hypothetical protein
MNRRRITSACSCVGRLSWHIRRPVQNEVMKKLRSSKEIRVKRPRRAKLSEKEALKRMKEFARRKEQFLATARTSKS